MGTNTDDLAPLSAEKIDDLYQPIPVRITTGRVWQWDEAKKALTDKAVQLGIADAQYTQIVSGDVKAGDQVVTNIVIPITAAMRQQQNQNIFNQGQRGGQGGFGGQGGRGGGDVGGGGGRGGAGGAGGGGGGGR